MASYPKAETVISKGIAAGDFSEQQVAAIRDLNERLLFATVEFKPTAHPLPRAPVTGFKLVGYDMHCDYLQWNDAPAFSFPTTEGSTEVKVRLVVRAHCADHWLRWYANGQHNSLLLPVLAVHADRTAPEADAQAAVLAQCPELALPPAPEPEPLEAEVDFPEEAVAFQAKGDFAERHRFVGDYTAEPFYLGSVKVWVRFVVAVRRSGVEERSYWMPAWQVDGKWQSDIIELSFTNSTRIGMEREIKQAMFLRQSHPDMYPAVSAGADPEMTMLVRRIQSLSRRMAVCLTGNRQDGGIRLRGISNAVLHHPDGHYSTDRHEWDLFWNGTAWSGRITKGARTEMVELGRLEGPMDCVLALKRGIDSAMFRLSLKPGTLPSTDPAPGPRSVLGSPYWEECARSRAEMVGLYVERVEPTDSGFVLRGQLEVGEREHPVVLSVRVIAGRALYVASCALTPAYREEDTSNKALNALAGFLRGRGNGEPPEGWHYQRDPRQLALVA